jgi:hypothetical protein
MTPEQVHHLRNLMSSHPCMQTKCGWAPCSCWWPPRFHTRSFPLLSHLKCSCVLIQLAQLYSYMCVDPFPQPLSLPLVSTIDYSSTAFLPSSRTIGLLTLQLIPYYYHLFAPSLIPLTEQIKRDCWTSSHLAFPIYRSKVEPHMLSSCSIPNNPRCCIRLPRIARSSLLFAQHIDDKKSLCTACSNMWVHPVMVPHCLPFFFSFLVAGQIQIIISLSIFLSQIQCIGFQLLGFASVCLVCRFSVPAQDRDMDRGCHSPVSSCWRAVAGATNSMNPCPWPFLFISHLT